MLWTLTTCPDPTGEFFQCGSIWFCATKKNWRDSRELVRFDSNTNRQCVFFLSRVTNWVATKILGKLNRHIAKIHNTLIQVHDSHKTLKRRALALSAITSAHVFGLWFGCRFLGIYISNKRGNLLRICYSERVHNWATFLGLRGCKIYRKAANLTASFSLMCKSPSNTSVVTCWNSRAISQADGLSSVSKIQILFLNINPKLTSTPVDPSFVPSIKNKHEKKNPATQPAQTHHAHTRDATAHPGEGHARTQGHTRTRTYTHALTRTHTGAHTHTHLHARTYTHSQKEYIPTSHLLNTSIILE